jgi:hypothetical protein
VYICQKKSSANILKTHILISIFFSIFSQLAVQLAAI